MGQQKPLTNGPAAAAILASGIGCLALGLFTTLAQALAPIKEALNFYSPTGPMSGKTILATAVWLVAWAMLHFLWRSEQVDFGKIFIVTLVLIALEVWPETPILPKPSFFTVDYRCNRGFVKRITYTSMSCKTAIRLVGVARNQANGFPARLLGLLGTFPLFFRSFGV